MPDTDGSEEEDDYGEDGEDDAPFVEPIADPVNVPVAAGRQVVQEEVQYGSTRLTNVGKIGCLRSVSRRKSFQNKVCKFEW